MLDFVKSASSFVLLGLVIIVLYADSQDSMLHKDKDHLVEGMIIGVCISAALATSLNLDLGLWMSLGMLCGEICGICWKKKTTKN